MYLPPRAAAAEEEEEAAAAAAAAEEEEEGAPLWPAPAGRKAPAPAPGPGPCDLRGERAFTTCGRCISSSTEGATYVKPFQQQSRRPSNNQQHVGTSSRRQPAEIFLK